MDRVHFKMKMMPTHLDNQEIDNTVKPYPNVPASITRFLFDILLSSLARNIIQQFRENYLTFSLKEKKTMKSRN